MIKLRYEGHILSYGNELYKLNFRMVFLNSVFEQVNKSGTWKDTSVLVTLKL